MEGDSRYHHYIVEQSTENAANHLGSEGAFWRQLVLLSKLKVTKQIPALLNTAVRVRSEVHVGCKMR
jgi:hypothetical protein